MAYEIRTRCFAYQPDHHPVNGAAHRFPAVEKIATLLLTDLTLIDDFSLLILQNSPIIPPGEPSITERYEDINGGFLSGAQVELAQLLEQVYLTKDQKQLNARRGAILERIVYRAVNRRKRVGDDVCLNASSLRKPGPREKAPNHYSVDVAACFPHEKVIELYACKLQVKHMPEDDVVALDALGEYFADPGRTAYTAVCCMQSRDDLDLEDEYREMMDDYPDVATYAIDEVGELIS